MAATLIQEHTVRFQTKHIDTKHQGATIIRLIDLLSYKGNLRALYACSHE